MSTNSISSYQALLGAARFNKQPALKGDKLDINKNMQNVDLWETYYTQPEKFEADYAQYLENEGLNKEGNQQDSLIGFISNTFGIKEDSLRANDFFNWVLDSVSDYDGNRDDLTMDELEANIEYDSTDYNYSTGYGTPHRQDGTKSLNGEGIMPVIKYETDEANIIKEIEQGKELGGLNLDSICRAESKAAKGKEPNSEERIAARSKIANAIGSELGINTYDSEGNYTEDFIRVMASIVPQDDAQFDSYCKMFGIQPTEDETGKHLDPNRSFNSEDVNKALDFLSDMNADGDPNNDKLVTNFEVKLYKTEVETVEQTNFSYPENVNFDRSLGHQNTYLGDKDEEMAAKAEKYIEANKEYSAAGFKFFKKEPKLDVADLNGMQLAQLIDNIYNNRSGLEPINFKNGTEENDKKVIKYIANALVAAEQRGEQVNAKEAMYKLAELDGNKLDKGKDYELGGDYLKYYLEALEQ